MASTGEKFFNINNIKSSKNVFKICPKFEEYMVVRGNTAAAYRSHPIAHTVPIITLPTRLDTSIGKYLRDMTITSPKSLLIQANSLRNSFWTRLILLEKNLQTHLQKTTNQSLTSQYENVLFSEKIMKDIETGNENVDLPLEQMIMDNAKTIMKMKANDVNQIIKSEIEEMKEPIQYSKNICNLYLVSRLASNYATCCKVLFEIVKRCPNFKPLTMFDFGSGVGSAAWAANTIWSNSIQLHTLVDASPNFLSLSEYLLNDGNVNNPNACALKGVYHRAYLPMSSDQKYDLVISAFSLLDISGGYLNRRAILNNLWEKTDRFLVIMELGNKAGFRAVLEARDWLITSTKNDKKPATILGPCPHAFSCPKEHVSCSFSVRYEKLRLTSYSTPTIKEVYSYVILYKGNDISQFQDEYNDLIKDFPRLVTYKGGNRHVQDLCMPDGSASRYYINDTNQTSSTLLKKCETGDLFPIVPIEDVDIENE